MSASGSSEDMALVKKLNALEVENKQLKKGEAFSNVTIPPTNQSLDIHIV